jgi:hypothetical protein
MKKVTLKNKLMLSKEVLTKFELSKLNGGEDRTYTTICGATCDKDCNQHSVICTGATRNQKC